MTKVWCSKDKNPSEAFEFNLDPNPQVGDTAETARKKLTDAGWLPPDDAQPEPQQVGFRFLAPNSQNTNLQESLLGKQLESYVPLVSLLTPGKQLLLTNAYKKKYSDLIGIATNWFFNRFTGVQIHLNLDPKDPKAIAKNRKVQKNREIGDLYQPMMLTDVKAANKNPDFVQIYRNVCVCVNGSVVTFRVNSWGAAGFTTRIETGAQADTIVNFDVYTRFDDDQDRFGSSDFRRWASAPQTIDIVGVEDLPNPVPSAQGLRLQKFTISTRNMSAYSYGGKRYSSAGQPPVNIALQALHPELADANVDDDFRKNIVNASHASLVRGEGIKKGTAARGDESTQDFPATMSDVALDSDTLGDVEIFFFVFKTWEDAVRTIEGINAPNADLWD